MRGQGRREGREEQLEEGGSKENEEALEKKGTNGRRVMQRGDEAVKKRRFY